jgi:3-oxoadipate enol-lactonase
MERKIIGCKELEAIDGKRSEAVVRAVAKTSPVLADAITEFTYGDIFSRAELGRRERELITVALLAAMGGAETQLRVHLSAALRCGAEYDELIALCEHLAPYAGFPRALNALSEVRAILEDRALKRPNPARRVHLCDHDTLVSDTGKGEPIILLHPLGLDWRAWRDVIPSLAKAHRVIAYDLRAHGHAAAAPRPNTLERLANDLLHLMDLLHIRKAEIAGLSYGGCVAQKFALTYPERVSSLILLATPAKSQESFAQRAISADHHGMESQVIPTLLRWFKPELLAEDPWFVRYARERLRRAIVEDWADSWRALAAMDTFDSLPNLRISTRVVAGECDASTPVAAMRELASRIPHSHLTVIPGGTHMLSLVKPLETASAILSTRI